VWSAAPQAYLSLTRCTFVKNGVTSVGGALYVFNTPAVITACTFTANFANSGGAVYDYTASPSISNCVFIGNTAAGYGGAIFDWYKSHSEITNCTFVTNTAGKGGAVAVQENSSTSISHCILWNNTATQGMNLYVARNAYGQACSTQATVAYSDVQSGRSSATVEDQCTLNWGSHNLNSDPLFIGPYQNDYSLSPDSPCIDAGDPAFIPPAGTKDLNGYPRQFGSTVDLGAFEYQGVGPVYRFWSESLGKHFYTIRGAERDKLINKYSDVWHLEGIAYYAFFEPTDKSLAPVYRFWSPSLQAHFWTASEYEKNWLMTNYADVWQYEGIRFYAYPPSQHPLGTLPVYRFWSNTLAHHFYTIDENEKNKLVNQYSDVWVFEGVAWYALAEPYYTAQGIYDFTGGNGEASYTLTLKAYIDGLEANIDQPTLSFVPQQTQARMKIDFVGPTTTLQQFHVQTTTLAHSATVKRSGISVPFTLSAQGSFDALYPRGPYSVDSTTGLFANFVGASQSLTANKETFSCQGKVTIGGHVIEFSQTASALQFVLESAGSFEAFDLLPGGLDARMPLTFQWQRPYVKDLLIDTSVSGHLVQIYISSMYVGTLGLWEGHAAE
jgi:hypothetical protein